MREIIYALRFNGKAMPIGVDGNVLLTAATGSGCTLESRVGGDGLTASLHPSDGEEATFSSEMVFTGATTFQESGTIAFGSGGHALSFSTLGTAYLSPVLEDDRRLGAAIWRVDGGEGQFAGAHGLILSTMVVDSAGEVTDHQFGVVYVRQEAGE